MSVTSALAAGLSPDVLRSMAAEIEKAAPLGREDYAVKFERLWESTEVEVDRLASQVEEGRIGAGQFRDRLFRLLRRSFADAYRYGLGSQGYSTVLSDADMMVVREYLSEDTSYLNGFVRDIRGGKVPLGETDRGPGKSRFTVMQRARFYSEAVRALYFRGQTSRQPAGRAVYWRALDDPHTCDRCSAMEAGNPWTVATLAGRVPGEDVCRGLGRCRCLLEYR